MSYARTSQTVVINGQTFPVSGVSVAGNQMTIYFQGFAAKSLANAAYEWVNEVLGAYLADDDIADVRKNLTVVENNVQKFAVTAAYPVSIIFNPDFQDSRNPNRIVLTATDIVATS